MLLLSGPPGSGKRQRVLDQVRDCLRRNLTDFRLLVPSTAVAAQLRYDLAREGFLIRPELIETFSRFIERWTPDLRELTPAGFEVLIGDVLEQSPPPEFRHIAHIPGFRSHFARLIQEFSAAGGDPDRLAVVLQNFSGRLPLGNAFHEFYSQVQGELSRRGWSLGVARLRSAAKHIRERGPGGLSRIFFEGFSAFTDAELSVIQTLKQQVDITITLPYWRGAEGTRVVLLAMGFREEQLRAPVNIAPQCKLFTAASLEREVTEIARRILEQVGSGLAFCDIAIVVRNERPYVPVIEAILPRFGVPIRIHFPRRLSDHAVIRYLTGSVRAMLGGWDHEETLAALRLCPSGIGATDVGDRFEYAVRERLPARGLKELRLLARHPILAAILDRFARLEAWRAGVAPAAEWVMRARTLRTLVRVPRSSDGVDQETIGLWRSQSAALDAFDNVADEAGALVPAAEPVSFARYWKVVLELLDLTPFRPRDQRYDVVNVMDPDEARQRDMPVIFLCGLVEQQFPAAANPDPVIADSERALLQRVGIPVRTAADLRAEEELLFDGTLSRAKNLLVLSYPEWNSRGEANLPSSFLHKFTLTPEKALFVRPPPAAAAPWLKVPGIFHPGLLESVRILHAALSPAAVEDFLRCPFYFFAAHTLCLEGPPPGPRSRLDSRVCGVIVRAVLQEWFRERPPLELLFERVFSQVCADHRIPQSWTTELARIALLRNLRKMVDGSAPEPGWNMTLGAPFQLPMAGDWDIIGRIDRYDAGPSGNAVVFSFHRSGSPIRSLWDNAAFQPGLSLLGLKHTQGLNPAGVFYPGKKGGWDGWHTGLEAYLKTGAECSAESLEALLEWMRQTAFEAGEAIRAGRIEPLFSGRCERCPIDDLCKAGPIVAGAAGSWD